MKKPVLFAIALSFASAGAYASTSFETADTDNNGKLSQAEYKSAVKDSSVYLQWDADNDGRISSVEFEEVGIDDTFTLWDADNDEYLDLNEVYEGSWSYYDEDENGHWDNGEWDDAGDAGFWDV